MKNMSTGPLAKDKACEFMCVRVVHDWLRAGRRQSGADSLTTPVSLLTCATFLLMTAAKFYFAYFWFSSASGGSETFA